MKLIEKSSFFPNGVVNFHFGLVYIYQLANSWWYPLLGILQLPQIGCFLQKFCNTVWCGQIKDRIILTRLEIYRKFFQFPGGTIHLIFSALVI